MGDRYYPRRYIEGDTDRQLRVYVMREGPARTVYGLRQSLIPVGLEFIDLGNGWGAVELVPWERCDEPDHGLALEHEEIPPPGVDGDDDHQHGGDMRG